MGANPAKMEPENGPDSGVSPGTLEHSTESDGSRSPEMMRYPLHRDVPVPSLPCDFTPSPCPLTRPIKGSPIDRLHYYDDSRKGDVLSPLVYNGTHRNIMTEAMGRSSPGHDLGYHTLVMRQISTPSHLQEQRSNSPRSWLDMSPGITKTPVRNSLYPSNLDLNILSNCPRNVMRPQPPQIPQETEQLLSGYKGKKVHRACPFDRLPDDLILKIFSYLSTNQLCMCARVCRRWYFLVWEPQLWSCISVTGENTQVDKALKTLTRLLSRDSPNVCLTVEKVILNGCSRLTDRGLGIIARKCPELRRLEMKGCENITNAGLFELVTQCVNLEVLDASGCSEITCISTTNDYVRSKVSREPHSPRQLYLQHLDLTDCHLLNDAGLNVIVKNCPQLQYLYIRRCLQITDAGIKSISGYCVLLKELSVSDCVRITDFGMYELAKLGPNLRYLSVAKCDQVSDAGIKQIARHCYKLRYLNVRGCEAVSDQAMEVLARSCPRLRALDIGKCDVTDQGLKVLSENCPNLKKLSVKSCDMITNKGIQCIAYYCRGLQQLNIQDCQITLEGYRTVKKYCKRCIIEHTSPGFC